MTPIQKAGQRFALGFTGTVPSAELRRLVKKYRVGNVILFRENLESAAQGRRLTDEIRNLIEGETGYPPFIALDQEGGVVTRLPADMVNVPGAMALAAAPNSAQALRQAARITAAELERIGVNLNLAPVLDVNSNPGNPVIGVRSLGGDAEEAGNLALEVIAAYAEAGLLCCGKHFPGHGDTAVDSHLALPLVDKSPEALEACELIPFKKAIAAGIPAIMTTHILFPRLEEQRLPATMSRTIITGLLKERLGFSGLVLSDGMEMKAIGDYYGIPAGCAMALSAGVDLVYVCHESRQMEASLEAVNAAYREGRYDPEEFDRSVKKILDYKERYAGFGREPGEGIGDAAAINDRLTRDTVTLLRGAIPPLGGKPFFTGPLAYRSTIASAKPDSSLSFASWFARRFGGGGAECSISPGAEEIAALKARAAGHSVLVLGAYNAHLNRAQLDLARALAELPVPLLVIALRNPYDLDGLPEKAAGLAAWEYSEKSFRALAAALQGEFTPHLAQ
ncbi:MAG: beta-N-acetylhexosaminidase [Treponema sp.]|nr:beta-N-acetylhexosaminidase [Treponema sp.]